MDSGEKAGITKTIGAKQKPVRERIFVSKASFGKLFASVWPQAKFSFRLGHFASKQTKQDVTAKAWGKRKLYKGTFIAKVNAGGKTIEDVFVRKTGARHPIKRLHGPSVPRTFASSVIQKVIRHTAEERFAGEFKQNLRWTLGKM